MKQILTQCGVPQGSPLSSTLFLVYINDLLCSLDTLRRLRSQGFADDLALWICGALHSGSIHPTLRHALWRAEKWSNTWRMRFHPQKCECMTFSGKTIVVQRKFTAFLYGEKLPYTHELRYLGIWFDAHMTWARHIREAVAKAKTRLWALKKGVGASWGLHSQLFLRLVRGVVIPSLFYGAPVWAAVLGVECRLDEIDGTLAQAARLAFSLERFTSVEASLALACIGPSRFHITRALVRYMYRYQYIPGTLWAMMVKPSQAPVYKQSEDKIQCSLSLARDGLTS